MTHASRPADHDSHNVPASVEPPPLPAHLQDLTERARTYVKAGSSANTRRVCAGLALAVPDHTTLSRRARTWQSPNKAHDLQGRPDGPVHILVDSTGLPVYGAGQWLEEKHGARSRRGWRKPHVALDADSSEIIAHTMTDQDAGDASQVEPLLNQIDGRIGQFTADGAYDGKPTYDAVTDHSAAAGIVIPPRANAIEPAGDQSPGQRDQHIAAISRDGRMKWQVSTGYGKRSLVETAIGRYKSIIGRRLRARSFHAQQTEVAIGCAALNRMLACARPKSIRRNGPTT